MNTPYQKIIPSAVFTPSQSEFPKAAPKIIAVLEVKPTGNDFINLFAQLMCENGNKTTAYYSSVMGIEESLFKNAVLAMTGLRAKEFIDEYIRMSACIMLEKTNWTITEIGKIFGFNSISSFSQYFRRLMKCQPFEYRCLMRTGKKFTYHYAE